MNELDRAKELQKRTQQFALDIIRLFSDLTKAEPARVIGRQFLRSGTSVAANYRAACRARSHSEFIAKVGVVLEEADETLFWLDLLIESDFAAAESVKHIRSECDELVKIFSSSVATAKRNR
jgi:four helix bundle protein